MTALGVCAVSASLLALAPEASAGSLSGSLYVDPNTQSARWVASNPNDYRAAAIRDQIASKPQSVWFTDANSSTIASKVSSYLSTAAPSGQIPVIVAYAIYSRDCSGASGGGASSISAYNQWTSSFVQGLGSRPVIVIVEPDSLALTTCLSSSQISERYSAIASFVQKIKSANGSAKVYLDAGHSAWNSASEAANRLRQAGVAQADGFFSNVSNYRTTSDEIAFGKNVLNALGMSNKHQVIDTSRNGNGPLGSEWCDPSGRLVGRAPTTNTGESTVDAFLWVKLPGEADGCAGAAGQFIPSLAYELAGSGKLPGGGTTTTTTTSRTTTTTTTTWRPPTTTTGNGGGGSGNGTLVTPGGKCLGVSGTGNGASAQIQSCNGGSGQSWSFNSDGSLRTLGASMCLDANGRGTANGTALIIYSCNGQANQKFAQGSNSSIVNSGSGRCVDVPNGSTNDGTNVQLYDCWGGDPQKWTYNGSGNTNPTTTTTTTTTTTRPTSTTTLVDQWPTTTTTVGGGAKGCSAVYKVTSSWLGGFQGEVTVTAGSSAISSWRVTWSYADGQTIASGWNATVSQSGSSVRADNAAWNGSLAAGASTAFGFQAWTPGTNSIPAVTCTAG